MARPVLIRAVARQSGAHLSPRDFAARFQLPENHALPDEFRDETQNGWSFYIYAAPSHTTLLIHDRIEVWSPKKGLRNELGRHLAPPQAA